MRDSKHRRGGLSPEEGREAPEPEQDEREQATRLVAAAHFASAFDSAPIGMALIDMEGRWLQVNDALCRITGYTRKELKATTLRAITHPDDVDRDADSLRDLLDGRVPSYQTEKRYRHAWGHHLWVLLTVQPASLRARPGPRGRAGLALFLPGCSADDRSGQLQGHQRCLRPQGGG
jgi:PAS domain S-box-containing protein